MKTGLLICSLLATALVSGAVAQEKVIKPPCCAASTKAKKATVAKTKVQSPKATANDTISTGTHIQQKVKRSGMVTDGSQNVKVLDQTAIRNSGALNVEELLVRRGLRR